MPRDARESFHPAQETENGPYLPIVVFFPLNVLFEQSSAVFFFQQASCPQPLFRERIKEKRSEFISYPEGQGRRKALFLSSSDGLGEHLTNSSAQQIFRLETS